MGINTYAAILHSHHAAFSLGADDSHVQHYGISGLGHLNWSAV
jgi:hypothetical protein